MPTGVPFFTPRSLSAFAKRTTSRCRSANVIVRRSSSGSPSQWYATLSPLPASTCRSTQLKQTLSLPPRYHFAYGGTLNDSLKCGDRHVQAGDDDKDPYFGEGEPDEHRSTHALGAEEGEGVRCREAAKTPGGGAQ